MLNLPDHERERLIDVDWGDDTASRYRVGLRIVAYDRVGLLRDISTLLSSQGVDVVAVNTLSDPLERTAEMAISLHIHDVAELATVMDRLGQLRNVQSVERTS